jgi:hypothetical protein
MTDDIVNLIPAKYRSDVLLLIALSPFITRAYCALRNGGGLRGVFSAIWFGTNTPKPTPPPTTEPTKQP